MISYQLNECIVIRASTQKAATNLLVGGTPQQDTHDVRARDTEEMHEHMVRWLTVKGDVGQCEACTYCVPS